MKNYFKLLLIAHLLTLASISYAAPATIPNMNSIHYANRAECAIESNSPTKSVFLVLDGYNAGKLGYSLGIDEGLDPGNLSNAAMKEFRLSLTKITQLIIDRLLQGKLPLLPTDLTSQDAALTNYRKIISSCGEKVYCAEMDQYLASLWANAGSSSWDKIDSITSKNFLPTDKSLGQSCNYIKRFSPLQGALLNTSVTKQSLDDLASSIQDQAKYIASCDSKSDDLSSRNAAIQIDIQADNAKWNSYGFDFWNSLRVYLSWAWRNAPEVNQWSGEFGDLFRSLALEDSMMFVPNGCQSVIPPSCTNAYLSNNDMRELAKVDNTTDFSAQIPKSPEEELLERGARSVSNDLLGTLAYPTASDWVANFRKNFVQSRGQMKIRYTNALRMLNLIFTSLSADKLGELINAPNIQSGMNNNIRDELYYLCTEYRLAADPRLDIMRSDIQRIQDLETLDQANDVSKQSIKQLFSKFNALTNYVIPLCDSLETSKLWDAPEYTINKSGFMPWAKEMLQISLAPDVATPTFTANVFEKPLLVWSNQDGSVTNNVICANGIDCARQVLKSIVDIYAISNYASAFMPISALAASPQLFNPYAELQSCKVYDPNFQARRAKKDLLADLANTALFGWNFLPIYASVDFSPAQVTSFNELVKNGQLQYDPKVQPEKMQGALIADFGPFLGAPCAISLSGNGDPLKSYELYAFTGVSVNYCSGSSTQTVVANSATDISSGTNAGLAACGACYLNFQTIAVATGAEAATGALGFNPLKLFVYLFRAIAHFSQNMSDPVNVPHAFTVNLEDVAQASQQHNSIPDSCVKMLGEGLKCFDTECNARAAQYLESNYGGSVSSVAEDPNDGSSPDDPYLVRMQSSLCTGNVSLEYFCSEDEKDFSVIGRPYSSDANCQLALHGVQTI